MRISTNLLIILSAFTTWIMASQFNSFQPEPELSRELVFAGTVYGFLDQQQIDYEPLGGVHVEVTVNGGSTFYAETWTNVTGSFSFDSDDYTNWPFFHEAQAVITADGYYQQELTLDFSSWPIIMEFYLNPLALMNNFLSGYVSSISEPDGNLVPIQGAVVEIFNNPDDGLLADFITDDTGYYEFGNIAYNANLIAVSAEGFVSQEAILPGFSETPIVLDFILIPVSDPSEFGSVSGSVTVTLTQGGTVYPLGDAMISATQSGADTLSFEVETNDEGNYLLELPVSNDLWQISCSTLFGDQYEEVLIEPSSNLQLDFHFNAWESQPLPSPQNLIGELSEDESQVQLEWEPPLEWPQFCVPHYTVLSNDMNDPQNEWIEIGDTYLLMWQDFQEPDSLGIDICYRVEAICLDIISEPGNIVCVQSWEVPYPPPPNGLTAIWDPDSGPNGTAILDWYYPIIPQPELTPLFSVYANLGELTENQFLYIGETTEFHFEYPFDEFTEPDSENCFRVQALLGEEISDFSNTACIYFNEEQPGSFQIWGYVYRADDQEMISDAMIQAGNVMNGVTYETVSDDTGYYELLVEPGEYIITGMIDYNILQQHHFILQNESELHLDFWFGEFPDVYHLSGIVYGETSNGDLIPLSYAEIMTAQGGIYLYAYANGGNYEIDLPLSGSWSVTVESDNFDILNQEIWLEGDMEQDFILIPLEEFIPVWISVGSVSSIPGDTVGIPLFIENQEPVSEISFNLVDDPQWLTAIDVISNLDCFTYLMSDDGFSLNVWLYSNTECMLDPGTHQFASIIFQIDDNAVFGQDINLILEDVSIIDEYENQLYVIAENGTVTLQLIGDINGDGDRNVLDVVQLVNFIILISEPDEYQTWAADLNEDETLDVLDIVILVNIILSGEG